MDSTQVKEIKPPKTQISAVTEKHVREVVVNYRGPKKESVLIDSPATTANLVRKFLPDNSREHFVALYLDGSHRLIGYAVAATGTATKCLVHPRELFQRAILLGAVAVAIGHNHPSGQAGPSADDEKVTKVLKEAGNILGIKVLDHVIVTEDEHFSFTQSGTL
jgi:DNA repair protein RadC